MQFLTFLALWAIIEILEKMYKELIKPTFEKKFRMDIIDEPAFLNH
jgi:hypothetical protein